MRRRHRARGAARIVDDGAHVYVLGAELDAPRTFRQMLEFVRGHRFVADEDGLRWEPPRARRLRYRPRAPGRLVPQVPRPRVNLASTTASLAPTAPYAFLATPAQTDRTGASVIVSLPPSEHERVRSAARADLLHDDFVASVLGTAAAEIFSDDEVHQLETRRLATFAADVARFRQQACGR